ncbi:PAS domain S-box protein [Marinilongibacter aquaticus]|uniref:PAS domain S-box protein n=1 Tax=Marinilongibacter aquaticus TaxID=2975157 RepID=UPI0021BD5AEC|nr:PAS domain S-box protein [Marinilongibacter aquaticus]UBM58053.1 PAS domain S-box protein [Marinilongibacter aquaticus]
MLSTSSRKKTTPYFLDWITADSNVAFVASEVGNLKDFCANPAFYKLFGTEIPSDTNTELSSCIEKYLEETLKSLDAEKDKIGITHEYKNADNQALRLKGEALLILEGDKQWVLIKYLESSVKSILQHRRKNKGHITLYGEFQKDDKRIIDSGEYEQIHERLEIIFNRSPIGIVILNKENQLVMVNPAGIRIFGLEKMDESELSKMSFKDLIHLQDFPQSKKYFQKLLNGSIRHFTLESRYRKANGETIWCRNNTSLMYTHGDDHLITMQFEDITESKKIQEESKENAKRFKTAFENSPNGMALVSITGQWLMVNNKICEMLGYTKEELMKLTFQELTYQDDLESDLHLLQETLDNKRDSYSMEKRYINKNGDTVYGLLHVSLLRDGQGKPQYFISKINDITPYVKAKKELEQRLNEVKTLMDATTQVAIIESDLYGTVKKFNKGAENLLGYREEEVVGTLRLNMIHDPKEIEQRAKEMSEEMHETINGPEVFIYKARQGEFYSNEWTYVRKDGTRFPVQMVITAVKGKEGDITGYLGIATDISKLKDMEKSLKKEKSKAEAASRSKSEFLANMSHEIRTPLNGVIGFTDLLMQTSLSETQRKYTSMVNTSANTLLDLINDILDFSKIEVGKLEIHKEKVDIVELCSQTLDVVKHNAHQKGLELLLNIGQEVKQFIYGDPIRLKQVIVNLLSNAVKFTEKGEVELKVHCEPIKGNKKEMLFTFSIRDTGIGIAPENISRIYNAFDQEDATTTRKYGGTGLGVTISNRLLDLMDSELLVDSTLNKGSIFSFKIKLKTEYGMLQTKKAANKIKRVLIVDDNENNLTIIEDMLAHGHIESVKASSGIEALDILGMDQNFDMVITDFNMPYITGVEMAEHIRKSLKLDAEKLPIMMLHSSIIDNEIMQACEDNQIEFNITKPVRIDQFFEYLNKVNLHNRPTEELAPRDSMSSKLSKEYRVLIAEDNPVNQLLARTLIEKILPNAEITIAEDGQKALSQAKSAVFDIIFMDIQMPYMSGFEVTEAIRNLDNSVAHTPIIALTARALKGEEEKCFTSGMDGYMTKPVIFNKMKEVIEHFLIK